MKTLKQDTDVDLADKEVVKQLCRQYGIKPKRESGQNFLADKNMLQKIVEAANLQSSDVVLEVGPGFGVLTQELAKRVKKVVAVEIDERLAATLKENLKDFGNVEVVRGDILDIRKSDFRITVGSPTSEISEINKIVANLPYNITARFLRRFIGDRTYMTLMLQKEVAERICAQPGKMSLLAVSVQLYAEPKIEFYVSKKSFWPVPAVDSAIIKIIPTQKYLEQLKPLSEQEFFKVVKIGFLSRRKQLQNNLAAGLKMDNEKIKNALVEVGLSSKVRAQELSIEEWIRLVRRIG